MFSRIARTCTSPLRPPGAEVSLIDLCDYPLPLYDGDLEESKGVPDNGMAMKKMFLSNHGLLISAPEYNSSITGVLKNTIDWLSRPVEGEQPLECFRGKIVGLTSASPGALGGLRGLVHVRAILENIGCIVLPDQMAISKANEAFDKPGNLLDSNQRERVEGIGRSVTEMLKKLV